VELVTGFGQGIAIVFVEVSPVPKGSTIDGKNLGGLGVVVALDDQFDGAELDIGEVCCGGNIPISLNFSRFREIFVGFGRGMGLRGIGGHGVSCGRCPDEKECFLYISAQSVKVLGVFSSVARIIFWKFRISYLRFQISEFKNLDFGFWIWVYTSCHGT
jgi:hypothetical protein